MFICRYKTKIFFLYIIFQEWEDNRISWNATEWDCDNPLINAERLWLPDVTLLNAAGTSRGDIGLRARLSSTGEIAWITRLDITIPVGLVLDKWPNDVQTTTVKFGSRAYSIDEMDLVIYSGKVGRFFYMFPN